MKRGAALYAVVCLAWVAIVAGLALRQGYPHALLTLGVPAQERLFGDMRLVTEGIEAAGRGQDVIGSDYQPTGYFPIRFPYHRFWLGLRHIGIGGSDTEVLALVLAVGMLGHFAILIAATGNHALTGLVMAAFACSPPVMLAIERGNPDLLLYLLLAGACHLLARRTWPAQASGMGLMFTAGALKFFPFAGALGILPGEHPRRRWALLATFAGAVVAFLVIERSDVTRIITSPFAASDWASFGSAVSANALTQIIPRWTGIGLPDSAAGLIRGCGVVVLVVAAFRQAFAIERHARRWDNLGGVEATAFVTAAGIFAGSFVLIRSYNYKFIFVALTVPALCRWSRRSDMPGVTARLGLATLLLWMWSALYGYAYVLANVFVSWVCVACFLSLLLAWFARHVGLRGLAPGMAGNR